MKPGEAAIATERGKEFDPTVADLRVLAQLARFHAHRSLAAVHYNLFLQEKNPSELAAAVAGEHDAMAAWRELVAIVGDCYAPDLAMGARNSNLSGHWRDELETLQNSFAELQKQSVRQQSQD